MKGILTSRQKIVVASIIIGILIVFFFQLGDKFAPGSYPYAEIYELEVDAKTLIKAVHKFKEENTSFVVPSDVKLEDGKRNNSDHWYHVYFYYQEKNQIVKTWIRPIARNKVAFAFVGINQGESLGNWKMINKDYSKAENKREVKIFEERVLEEIKRLVAVDN